MINRILLAAVLVFVGACASTNPESSASEMAASEVDKAPVENPSAATNSEIPMEEAPDVESSAMAAVDYDPNEKICKRERVTGSRFITTICRTRAEIEERKAKDQETLRQMRSTMSGSDCALNQGC